MKNIITMQKIEEMDTSNRVKSLLNQNKYRKITKDDRDFIFNKIYSEWSNLSPQEILNKVENLANSLV